MIRIITAAVAALLAITLTAAPAAADDTARPNEVTWLTVPVDVAPAEVTWLDVPVWAGI